MNFDIDEFVNFIFSSPPKPPCSFNVNIENESKFPVLLKILLDGAKKLYGQVAPQDISERQYDILNEYMESIGFSIKYNYTVDENDNNKITHINVWFVPYMKQALNCGIYMK